MKEKAYSGVAALPTGQYTGPLTPGCMVLEGGAFRGVYTSGVLDALLQAGIQMQCTIGVSAGALTGLNYVAGQIPAMSAPRRCGATGASLGLIFCLIPSTSGSLLTRQRLPGRTDVS